MTFDRTSSLTSLLRSKRQERTALIDQAGAIQDRAAGQPLDPAAAREFDQLHLEARAIGQEIDRLQQQADAEQELRQLAPDARTAGREDRGGDDEPRSLDPFGNEVDAAEERRRRRQGEAEIRSFIHQRPVEGRSVLKTTVDVYPSAFGGLTEMLKTYGGVRQAGAHILSTTNGNDLLMPVIDDTANGAIIKAEAQLRSDVLDPVLTGKTLSAYLFDSKWVKFSIEALSDGAINWANVIMDQLSTRIARTVNAYMTNGTGIDEPEGVVTGSTLGVTAASATGFTALEVISLIHSIDPAYRSDPTFRLMMADSTLAHIRKFTDGNGRFLLSELGAGTPVSVLGTPVVINNEMPTLASGAGSKVILAGAFKHYVVRDVLLPRMVRADQLFIDNGLIGFKIFSRHDGKLVNTSAVKHLALAAA